MGSRCAGHLAAKELTLNYNQVLLQLATEPKGPDANAHA